MLWKATFRNRFVAREATRLVAWLTAFRCYNAADNGTSVGNLEICPKCRLQILAWTVSKSDQEYISSLHMKFVPSFRHCALCVMPLVCADPG